jgi:antitoxin CcdA
MDKRLPTKRALNVLIDANLLEAAKKSGLKFSAVMDKALRQELAERWSTDNAGAIAAYNDRIERDGLWIDRHRGW